MKIICLPFLFQLDFSNLCRSARTHTAPFCLRRKFWPEKRIATTVKFIDNAGEDENYELQITMVRSAVGQPQFLTFRLSPRRFLSSSTIFCSSQFSLTFLPTDALSMTRQGPVMLISVMLTRRECTFLGGGERVQTHTISHSELMSKAINILVTSICTLVFIFIIRARRNKNFIVENISG